MKTSVSLRAPRLVATLALAFASLSVSTLSAQNATVSTIPVGAVSLSIAAGSGAVTKTLSTISFPLIETAVIAGKSIGTITGVTSNTITDSTAGWTAGQLSTAATPCLIQITSGASSGRMFLISTNVAGGLANTATTVTIDNEEANASGTGLVNISALVAPGDNYRILACDTLNTLFGGPSQSGILAGANATVADTVQVLNSGTYRTYWHTGTRWQRTITNASSNDTVLRPDALIVFNRLGNSTLSLTITGEVPSINRKATVRNSGLTTLATGFPADFTLTSSGIASMPGWVASSNATIADNVQILNGTSYRTYYYTGTRWNRTITNAESGNATISGTAGVIINKKGAAAGSVALSQARPYSVAP